LEEERELLAAGIKQCRKCLSQDKVYTLYLACDADPILLEPLRDMAKEKNVSCDETCTMKTLGKKAGIAVGTAALAVLK